MKDVILRRMKSKKIKKLWIENKVLVFCDVVMLNWGCVIVNFLYKVVRWIEDIWE